MVQLPEPLKFLPSLVWGKRGSKTNLNILGEGKMQNSAKERNMGKKIFIHYINIYEVATMFQDKAMNRTQAFILVLAFAHLRVGELPPPLPEASTLTEDERLLEKKIFKSKQKVSYRGFMNKGSPLLLNA